MFLRFAHTFPVAKSKYYLALGLMYSKLHRHTFNMQNYQLALSNLFRAIKKATGHGHQYDLALAHFELGEIILEEDLAEHHQRQAQVL